MFRGRQAALRVLTVVFACTIGLIGADVWLSAGAAQAATTQYGCTFSVPKPAIAKGVSAFAVSVKCARSSSKRQARVELVADDPSYDDALRGTTRSIGTGEGKSVVAGAGWSCQEDSSGSDEVYLRVRIESHQGNAWKKASWINGSVVSGDCR